MRDPMSAIEEHYAKEAERLLNDDVLAEAMTAVRTQALVALATVDPDNKTEIMRQQAIANCLQDVRDALYAMILKSGAHDGGVDPNPTTSAS